MAYIKQNFSNGEILTAENLNLMEDGIIAKQDIENLTTVLDENSDDTHYPSAKATYDLFKQNKTSTSAGDGENAIVQSDNEALGDYSIALGKNNKTLSDYSMCEGLLNISGAKLNTPVECNVLDSVLDSETSCAKITVEGLSSDALSIEDHVIIFASNFYFSCKVMNIVTENSNTIIHVLNHNVSGSISSLTDKSTVKIYKVDETNTSDSCHTEHLEGAYNISAATGDGVNSSRVTHIEGHTNISFGQYNHLEGVRNKALNQTEFTHIEGRMNTADGENSKVLASHIRGERNIVKKSSYTTVGGYANDVTSSTYSTINGFKNTVSNSPNSFVNGNQIKAFDVSDALIQGSNLIAEKDNKVVLGEFNEANSDSLLIVGNGTSEENRKNALEITGEGDLKYLDKNKNLVSLNKKLDDIKLNNLLASKQLVDSHEYEGKFINPDIGLLYIKDATNVSKISTYSRNILDKDYYYKSIIGGKTGIDFVSNDLGEITIKGQYTGNIWAQFVMYNTDKPFYFESGVTYILGRECTDSSIEFRITYYNENGTMVKVNSFGTDKEITWSENYTFNSIMIQAAKQDYNTEVLVRPYIYVKGKELDSWEPSVVETFNLNETNLIDTTNNNDGQIILHKENEELQCSLTIDTYAERNLADMEHVEDVAERVAELESSKVDKNTDTNRIYATGGSGEPKMLYWSESPLKSGIVRRTPNMQIRLPLIPDNDSEATSKKYVDSLNSALAERVTELESLTLTFTEDTSTAYEKAVPAEVGRYALVKMIGGATEKVVVGKNILNPKDIELDTNFCKDITYNSDGSISFVVSAEDISTGLDMETNLTKLGFTDGKYYVYVDAQSNCRIRTEFYPPALSIYIWDSESSGVDAEVTLKIMIWKYEDSDTVEFTEAPEGTVFEPYTLGFQDAEVERIESRSKNLANPEDIPPFRYYGTEEFVSPTVNADGSISFTLSSEIHIGAECWTNFGLSAGKYYYLLEGVDGVTNFFDSLNIMCDIPYSIVQGEYVYPDEYTFNVKVMVYKYEDSDTVEFTEAPEGTVFEPYKDGDSIEIPFEAIKAKIDGFGKMVNDTYYDYIEFVDDKVFGYKVADEIVLNGTEDGWVKYSTSQTPYFYIPSFLPNFVPAACTSDLYDQTKVSVTNTNIGINTGTVGGVTGTVVVRPPNYAELTVEGFKAQLAERPITLRYAFATPEVTDITDLFTEDNTIEVQQGGTITPVNKQKMPVPSNIVYITRKG